MGKNNPEFPRKVKQFRTEEIEALSMVKEAKPLKVVWFLTGSEEIGSGVKVSACVCHFGHEPQESIWALVEDPVWLLS